MENLQTSKSQGWNKSLLWVVLATVCFHMAYTSLKCPAAGLFIFGYAYFLVRLTDQPTVRRAFYFGLAAGYLCYAPQLFFMWNIFGPFALLLWFVLAFWVGLFAAIVCGSIRRWGKAKAVWLVPFIWTGLEYFRSELYYLKFSWMNIGYALPPWFDSMGMYGTGFVVVAIGAVAVYRSAMKRLWVEWLLVLLVVIILGKLGGDVISAARYETPNSKLSIVGIQLEFPSAGMLSKILNQALAKNTNAQIFVLSEYTLDGGVPEGLKDWCRDNGKYLIVGGKDVLTNNAYYNTAFVVGTNGEIVFKQAKSVPIQFFRDGLPAPEQAVWNSPWGKIGICVCYDLSYTRVTDELVRQGAQLLIAPTMDVETWGRHQHELHFRVAPVRAAEYGVPIFRLASSGISQAVRGNGAVIAQTRMAGMADVLAAQIKLPLGGVLPSDRCLAPVCTWITALIMAWLLWLEWKDKRGRKAGPVSRVCIAGDP
jgi:apolipoprotein N-acyltransferase